MAARPKRPLRIVIAGPNPVSAKRRSPIPARSLRAHPRTIWLWVTLVISGGLAGCAGANFRLHAVEGETVSFTLRGENNELALHSYSGKKRSGDGPLLLNPTARLDTDGEQRYGIEAVHKYEDAEHSFGGFSRLEFVMGGRDTLIRWTTDSDIKSRDSRRLSALGWFSLVGAAAEAYDLAECRQQTRYECREPTDYNNDDYWSEKTVYEESGVFDVSREDLLKLSEAKSLEVSVMGPIREVTYGPRRIPFAFRRNIGRFLDTLKIMESTPGRRSLVHRRKTLQDSVDAAQPEPAAVQARSPAADANPVTEKSPDFSVTTVTAASAPLAPLAPNTTDTAQANRPRLRLKFDKSGFPVTDADAARDPQ